MVLSYIAKDEWTDTGGTLHMSMLDSVIVAKAVTNVTFQDLEIRHAQGAAIVVENASHFVVDSCAVADAGMMGMNVTVR